MARGAQNTQIMSQQLLMQVAEQLKLPLQQIARHAEYGQLTGEDKLSHIQTASESALLLLDNFSLGLRLNEYRDMIQLEPVSVSSVLYDSGQQLYNLAKMYGVQLELDVAGKFGPVQANRKGLEAALVSLGAAMIESLPAQESTELRLQLATHRSRYGIVAGIYGDGPQVSASSMKRARQLQGSSRQPFNSFSHTTSAGIFVADNILRAMNLRLRSSRHHSWYGFGAVLKPNPQMQLI